jgi:predicted RNase H-like HicB family nuclease
MKNLRFTYWKDEDYFIGFLNDFPDYESQGTSLEELKENLSFIYHDIESNEIPYIRHISELVVS